jgi:signal transduction histidine kinase
LSKSFSYRPTFFGKGLLIVALPLLSGSICLWVLTNQWKATTSVAGEAQQRAQTIKVLDLAFQSLLERGYHQFSAVFNQNQLAGPIEPVSTEYYSADRAAENIVLQCRSLEAAVDKEAAQMRLQIFRNNVQRLLGYSRIIVPTIKVADKIDYFVAKREKLSASGWKAWDRLHERLYLSTLAAFLLSAGLACLLCLFFSYDLIKRIFVLAQKAAYMGSGSAGRAESAVAGGDELAFLDKTFQDVAHELEASFKEREMLVQVVAENILKPAVAAREFVHHQAASGACSQMDAGSQRLAESVKIVDSAFNKIDAISRQLIAVEGSEKKQQTITLNYFSLPKQVGEILAGHLPAAELRSIELQNNVGLIYLMSDRERFGRVLSNLVANGIKFSPLNSELSVTAQVEQDSVKISVLDRGPGLSANESGQVFEKYYQSEGQAKSKGFGLGLAICKDLVAELGGAIGYEKRTGGGSEFWFSLPLAPRIGYGSESALESGSESQASQPQTQSTDFRFLRSPTAKKFLLLLILPLLSQACAFAWLYNRMESAYTLLDRVRRQEALTFALSCSRMNLFAAGYLTALYLSSPGGGWEKSARKHLARLKELNRGLEPVAVDGVREAAALRDLCASTAYQIASLQTPLDQKQVAEAQDLIGAFLYMLNSSMALSERMNAILEQQFQQIARLAAEQEASQSLVQSQVMLILCANMFMAVLLAYAFSRTFASRVNRLVSAARGLPGRVPVQRPGRIGDEIDQLQDLLAMGSERLIAADIERETFISAIAHDIRSPLQAINILLATLERRDRESKASEQSAAQYAAVCGSLLSAAEQVDNLLTLNKLKQSQQHLEICNVDEILLEAVAQVMDLATGKDVFIDFAENQYADGDNAHVRFSADPQLLELLFIKLLTVSIKNAPRHSTVMVTLQATPGLALTISAGGQPLPPVTFPIALKEASRSHFETLLALAVCQQLAALNHLAVRVSSSSDAADHSGNVFQLESRT